MEKNSEVKILRGSGEAGGGMNRREMVRRILGGAGLASAAPLAAFARPVRKHSADPAASTEAQTATKEAKWKPLFLDLHQSATFEILAERIVPGSTQAKVMPFVDLLLSVDTQQNQKKFLASLSAFDAESLRRYSHPYKDLTEAQQNQILTVASTAQAGADEKGKPADLSLRDHFENLKGRVSGAYYSSETGMKEMGWTGQFYFTSFPGQGCGESGSAT
jgi:Gluconate 2-dehydrogenase subunit 3